MSTTTPTLDQLKRGLEISQQIAALETELAGILGNHSAPAAKAPPASKTTAKATPVQKKKGGMSAAGKARVAAAQKARWAKIKAAKAPVASKAPAKADAPAKKRTMSQEARAKIAAAVKARWAALKKK